MKKELALSLLVILLVTVCDVPALSDNDLEDHEIYREYRDDLYLLQKDITQIYLELHQGKNLQAVYEHIVQTVEKTAAVIGEAELASHNVHDALQISLQDHLEIVLILGLFEKQKENLINLRYTEEEIAELSDWLLHYNDYYHHATAEFTAEEIKQLHSLGLAVEQIAELQHVITEHYTKKQAAHKVVKQQQTELMKIQALLSLAALQALSELEKDSKGKAKDKGKDASELLNAEEKLLEAILTVSEDQSSLEHVKAFSKQVYKAAEQQIRKGNNQYFVDFFVGLQVHCGAVTALNGDTELGVAEIQFYRGIVSECAVSPERPVPQPIDFTCSNQLISEETIPLTDSVGRVEEFDETNNLGVAVYFVKTPDTTLPMFLMLFSDSIVGWGSIDWFSLTLPDLTNILNAVFAVEITINSVIVGAAGAVLLLILTAPVVGYEWPSAVPGWIEGDEVIVIVEGSYGQGHITERANSKEKCIASSHQAILDNKYMIQEIVKWASKLFYNKETGQYIYYLIDDAGKEWAIFIEKYEYKYYQLITAYRVDCPSPYRCKTDGKDYPTIIEKWICEGFKLISLW